MKWGGSCVASWFSEWKNPDTVDFPVAATGKCHDGTSEAASVFNPIWTRFSCTCYNSSRTDRDYNVTRTSKDCCYKLMMIICFLGFFYCSFGTMSSWSGIRMSVTASPGFLSLWSNSGLQTSLCMSCEYQLSNCSSICFSFLARRDQVTDFSIPVLAQSTKVHFEPVRKYNFSPYF